MKLNNVFDHYRQHLSRMVKRSTREDYNKRLAMLSTVCSMQGITSIEDIDFVRYLDWLFIERGIAPRTYNNYRTWCRAFCKWFRQREYLKGNPLECIKPLRETPKQSHVNIMCIHPYIFLFLPHVRCVSLSCC